MEGVGFLADENFTFAEKDFYEFLHANVDSIEALQDYLLPNDDDFITADMSRVVKTTLCVLYTFLSVGAIFGNVCILFVIITRRSFRTETNIFIISLAVSDILIAAWNMPLQLLYHLNSEWTLGEGMCKLTSFIQGISILTSILALTAVAIERYHAICNPMEYRSIRSTRSAILMIVILWTVAIVVMLPHLWIQRLQPRLSWQLDEYPPIRIAYLCVEVFPKFVYNVCYSFGFFIIFFVLPVAMMTYAYGKMATVLWLRGEIGEPLSSNKKNSKMEKQKKNIIRMFIVIVFCYILCWLPFFAINIVMLFFKFTSSMRVVQAFALLFGYSNAFVNALIYFFLNAKFNRLVKQKLSHLCSGNSKYNQPSRNHARLLSQTTSV